MATMKMPCAVGSGGESIAPVFENSLSGLNASTYTYVTVPKKPQYVCLIIYHSSGYSITNEWYNDVVYQTYVSNGYKQRQTTSTALFDVQDDKVGFKSASII